MCSLHIIIIIINNTKVKTYYESKIRVLKHCNFIIRHLATLHTEPTETGSARAAIRDETLPTTTHSNSTPRRPPHAIALFASRQSKLLCSVLLIAVDAMEELLESWDVSQDTIKVFTGKYL